MRPTPTALQRQHALGLVQVDADDDGAVELLREPVERRERPPHRLILVAVDLAGRCATSGSTISNSRADRTIVGRRCQGRRGSRSRPRVRRRTGCHEVDEVEVGVAPPGAEDDGRRGAVLGGRDHDCSRLAVFAACKLAAQQAVLALPEPA